MPIMRALDIVHWQYVYFFFFNDTATTEIYTLSLHDALPICRARCSPRWATTCSTPTSSSTRSSVTAISRTPSTTWAVRSEEHTSELQSRQYLVCRLLLEKKKKHTMSYSHEYIIVRRKKPRLT